MKLSKSILAAIFGALLFCGAVGSAYSAPRVLISSDSASSENNMYKAMDFLADRVKELSNGQLEIQNHHNGVLGTEAQNIDSVRLGTIDMGTSGTNNAAGFTDAFLVGDLPFIYKDIDGIHKVWWGPIGRELNDKAEKDMGIKILGVLDNGCGFRILANNKHPVRVPADTKDLKLRVAGSPIEAALYKKWGASGTPVPWSDTYSALEQKVIDGELLHPAWIYWAKHHEALKYMTDDANNISNQNLVMMNMDTWNSLTPEEQKILMQALEETQRYNAKISQEMADQFIDKLTKECGMEYYKPTPEERQLWREDAMAIWPEFSDRIPEELVKRIMAAQEE